MECVIEALKEMMLGEPIGAKIEHRKGWETDDMPCTWLQHDGHGHYWMVWEGEECGTDGEEVYVIVIRRGRTKDDIPSTDVQVCPGATQKAGQGV